MKASLLVIPKAPKAERQIDFKSAENQIWWNFTAFLGLASGVSFGVLGLFFTCVAYFSGDGNISEIYQIAATFVLMAFSLALSGAYALYKLEKSKREIK